MNACAPSHDLQQLLHSCPMPNALHHAGAPGVMHASSENTPFSYKAMYLHDESGQVVIKAYFAKVVALLEDAHGACLLFAPIYRCYASGRCCRNAFVFVVA